MNDEKHGRTQFNILIVDDNPANLRFLTEILETQGYITRPVTNASHALLAARTSPPDVILLDVMLPDQSGYQVCEQLKADERTYDIPIIFISARDEVLDKVKAFSIGGIDYITKPFQVEEVLARVRTHLTIWDLQKHLKEKTNRLEQEIWKRECTEQQIRRLNVELEKQVEHRTMKFEAANKELRNFMYVASHDLKTPLRGINQLTYWLMHDYTDRFDEHGKEMMRLLSHRVKRMDRLIDGIIQYARIERISRKEEAIPLDNLLQEILARLAPPGHITIVFDHTLPVLTGEKPHVEKIFEQLLLNAIQAFKSAEGRVTIGCREHDHEWEFSVTDDGPGIEKKYHKKIFQIFQILTPHDECDNTGVGLALVKKIVELYGGKIWVESQPGEGSTFRFTFPKST